MTTLKPVNGIIACTRCNFKPTLDAYHSHFNPDAKAGDDCTACSDEPFLGIYKQNHKVGKYKVRLETQLGPTHAIEITGNPLLDAATILQVDGWQAGEFVCDKGKKCLDGALRAACGLFADPNNEYAGYGKSYAKSAKYQTARNRMLRAEVALATEILVTTSKSRSPAIKGWRETFLKPAEIQTNVVRNLDRAQTIIVHFNDDALARRGGRKGALDVLRRAAERYKPHSKILPPGI